VVPRNFHCINVPEYASQVDPCFFKNITTLIVTGVLVTDKGYLSFGKIVISLLCDLRERYDRERPGSKKNPIILFHFFILYDPSNPLHCRIYILK
jgi:hypothetical protein